MEFLNAGFLWGTAAVAVPIVIHLLNRQRYKKVEWAAMRFLLEAVRRTRRRLRLEEILLLAVRCAIFLLIAAALARPVLSGSVLGMQIEGNVYAIIALDASYSMGARIGHQSVFERGQDVARQILSSLKRGDKASIVLLSERPQSFPADPSSRIAELQQEVGNLQNTAYAGSLVQSLQTLQRLVAARPLPQVRLYIITDQQARFWERLDEAGEAFRAITRQARTVVVDVGGEGGANLTALDLRTDLPIVSPGVPLRFLADVANYSPAPVRNAGIALLVDGRPAQTQSFSADPGQTVTVSFSHVFLQPGPHTAQIQLDPDALVTDNARYLAVQVEEQIPVLIVDPKGTLPEEQTETWLLRFALNPQLGENRYELAPFRPDLATPAELESARLEQYRIVFLANVESLSADATDRLVEFVKKGGGIVTFLGDRVDPRRYNERFFRNGEGFLPAGLNARAAAPDPNRYLIPVLEPVDHPVLRRFRENRWPFELYAYQFFTCDPLPADALALARFPGVNAPAVIERPIGRGRSVLFSTSCGDPRWASFLPEIGMILFLQEYSLFLTAGTSDRVQILVGDPFSLQLRGETPRKDLLLFPPAGEPIPHRPARTPEGGVLFTVPDTETPGLYRVETEGRTLFGFAANVNPAEGDLTRLPQDRAEALRRSYGIGIVPMEKGLEGLSDRLGGKEIWEHLLLALVALMLGEMLLAWKFGTFRSPGGGR